MRVAVVSAFLEDSGRWRWDETCEWPEQKFPRTAQALASWQVSWVGTCQDAFADLDLDLARQGLTRSIAAYLGESSGGGG